MFSALQTTNLPKGTPRLLWKPLERAESLLVGRGQLTLSAPLQGSTGALVGLARQLAGKQLAGKEPAMTEQRLIEDQIQRMITSDPDALEASEDQLA